MIKKIITSLLFLILLMFVTGCNKEKNTLSIADLTVYVGQEAVDINPEFSIKEEKINYVYNEKKLLIINNKIEGFEEGEFEVTATTNDLSVTFKVTCIYAIFIADMYAWVDYPASDIAPVVNVEGNVNYTTESNLIRIENGKITAIAEGNSLVTAAVGEYSTKFLVKCLKVDRTNTSLFYWQDNWKTQAASHRSNYQKNGTDGKTTIFIGDSFFDPYFFSRFNMFYEGKDALCLGIGATTSQTWEMLLEDTSDGYYSQMQPKNIVVQIGNNNVYHNNRTVLENVEDLQRFFTLLHTKMPNTQIYYFAITPRNETFYRQNVYDINRLMKEYCQTRDWIVFMDTCDEMTYEKLYDNIHPAPEHYQIFVTALEEAKIQMEDKLND